MITDKIISISTKYNPEIILANEVLVKAPNCHFKRKADEFIWYIILEGKMILHEQDKTYYLEQGNSIILTPGNTHWGSSVQSDVRYLFVHFTWKDAKEMEMEHESFLNVQTELRMNSLQENGAKNMEETILFPKYCEIKSDILLQVYEDFKQLIRIWNNALEYSRLRCSNALVNILLDIMSTVTDRLVEKKTIKDQKILEIMLYLRNHYNQKIKSSNIEDYFHLNFNYMNRKFREYTGKTIFQYLTEYRISYSKKMLKSGIYTNAEIADKLQFCNEFYFAKVFKKSIGLTPKEYKNLY